MKKDYNFHGKVAIVTGGGGGIGRAIALGFTRCGAKVVLASRSKEALDNVVDEIKSHEGDAFAHVTDLMKSDQIDDLVDTTVKAYGRLDILVNNAARSHFGPLMELREDGWDKIFGTNCRGAFLLSRAAARVMAKQDGGRIVNITTIGVVRGAAGLGAYQASKAALTMLTKCMAVEWAPFNINVNAVGPGMTKTAFSQPLWKNPDMEKRFTSRIPKGRLAEPEEMVGPVLFLCSEDSNYITGETIYVDGGTLANN